jgi:hypothetical protein
LVGMVAVLCARRTSQRLSRSEEKNGSRTQKSRPACSLCVDQCTNANIRYGEGNGKDNEERATRTAGERNCTALANEGAGH